MLGVIKKLLRSIRSLHNLMSLFTILFILIHIVSLGVTTLAVRSLYIYIRKFRFERNQYEPLFGFVHLRHVAVAYIVMTLALAAYSSYFFIQYYG